MKDVTILINSCDKYKDAWVPFLELLKIQWPSCQYDMVLNTEEEVFEEPGYNVRTICGGKTTWSRRLKKALENIETEYVCYFLEDFFLESPVSVETFEKALKKIKSDETIGYIGLKYNKEYRFKDSVQINKETDFYDKDDLITCNRINSMTALWRKEWLYSLIRNHETPWEFELYGSIRSKRSNKKVLIINNYVNAPVFDYSVDIEYGMGITMGKWLPMNKVLFEKYGIEVNYDGLGVHDGGNNYESNSNEQLNIWQQIREKLYWFKWKYKRIRKWGRKQYRKIKSLI